jgi:translation initiation factor 2B subunit (eIF-2B alpha/beta/delta family)
MQGDPDDLVDTVGGPTDRFYSNTPGVTGNLAHWRTVDPLILLSLYYDVTPANFVTLVACENGLIPSTLVLTVMHDMQ